MSYLKFQVGAAPSTPAANKVELYVDTADKRLKSIDETPTTRVFVDRGSTETLSAKKLDSTCTDVDASDATKVIAYSLSGMTTGVTLTLSSAQATSQTLTIPTTRQAETLAIKPQIGSLAPADPTGTTNTTGLMMGLCSGTTIINPQVTGRVFMMISGTIANATAIADGANVQLRYGTGNGPANAAALTGTTVGGLQQYIAATTAEKVNFSCQGVVTGLAINTAIYIDVGLAAVTGGTATVKNIAVNCFEF